MRQHKTPVRELARGKWHGLLLQFGLPAYVLNGKAQACPLCRDGKDRFRWDDKDGNGTYFCSQCGSGDGFMLAEKFTSMDFSSIAKRIEEVSGTIYKTKPKQRISKAAASDLIRKTWKESKEIKEGDPAWQYLTNRGLALKILPLSMRYHAGLEYRDGTGVFTYPAIVMLVASPSGQGITIHRTYIKDGKKAPVPQPKKLMPVPDDVTVNGGAVRLFTSGLVLGLAEGMETALAASELHGIPVWSTLTAGGMETFELPETSDVQHLIIYADHDPSFTGQKSAYVLAHRLWLKHKNLTIEVCKPPFEGDWLDELIRLKNLPK